MRAQITAGLAELAALALPATCASCGAADHAVCRECRDEVSAAVWAGGPRHVEPRPRPPGLPQVWATAPYGGALGRLVTAYKDDDRRDVRTELAPLLTAAVDAALAGAEATLRTLARGDGPVLLVPAPTSRAARRRRGDAPLLALARSAVSGYADTEVVCADALRLRRRVADQAGLTARQRQANLDHAIEVRPRWAATVVGAPCLLVDDVLTTGATLVEAARALRRAGASDVVAATICATARRSRRASS